MGPDLIAWCAANMASIEVAEHDLVAGHHTPEDQPQAIATAVASWLDKHHLRADG
jgi:haloalkane dehalogenase